TCTHSERSPLPKHFPDLRASPTSCVAESFREFPPEHPNFEPRLTEGVTLGVEAPPGYPTLFSLPLKSAVLMKAGVDVFGRRSRRESLCIRVSHQVPIDNDAAVVIDGSIVSLDRERAAVDNETSKSPDGLG
ncbi:hypothetical protein T484DRAFT_1782948, partial [Baffinella frigidus]